MENNKMLYVIEFRDQYGTYRTYVIAASSSAQAVEDFKKNWFDLPDSGYSVRRVNGYSL